MPEMFEKQKGWRTRPFSLSNVRAVRGETRSLKLEESLLPPGRAVPSSRCRAPRR